MLLDSPLEEGLDSLYHLYMDVPQQHSSSLRVVPSSTLSSSQSRTESQSILITTPPELRLRNPVPEPQAADCSQADQSASQAIQRASQQASQSIQQAQQQASQSVSQASQQAAQSASQAIQQFSNSASQSIAAASRSVTSAISSASQAVASAQSSAAAAISRANGSMVNAQVSLTVAQSQASAAVLQAGAAVAAATGSAAAAGSSFLAAAGKATQSAQASVSAIGAQASQQVSQASQQVTASQNAAVTATQAALAIVGSIIASALVTILIFFLVARHKKKAKAKAQSRVDPSLGNVYFGDPKFPASDQAATTAVPSQSAYTANRDLDPMSGSQVTLSLFPKAGDEKPSTTERKKNEELRKSVVKSTTVPWNPNKPPKAPTLGSWLKLQDGVSPFGPIKLPLDGEKSSSPLGGQLKSPMTTNPPQRSPRMSSGIPIPIRSPGLAPKRSPKLPILMNESSSKAANPPTTIIAVPKSPLSLLPVRSPKTPKNPDTLPQHSMPGPQYRESTASVWTDDIPDRSPSPPLQSPPPELKGKRSVDRRPINSMQKVTNMEIPPPVNPIRNTAEWFAERARLDNESRASRASRSQFQSQYGTSSSAYAETSKNNRPSFGLPRGPKISANGMGLPSRPGPNRGVLRASQADAGYVQGLNRFLGKENESGQRGSSLSRMGSDRSANASTPGGRSVLNTPGVGKAL